MVFIKAILAGSFALNVLVKFAWRAGHANPGLLPAGRGWARGLTTDGVSFLLTWKNLPRMWDD